MAHVFQVGAGSGGIVVLDLIARDPRVTRLTLVEPDVYKPHNVHRHLFPLSAVVQAMRKTQQTSLYLDRLGPFLVARAIWQSPL